MSADNCVDVEKYRNIIKEIYHMIRAQADEFELKAENCDDTTERIILRGRCVGLIDANKIILRILINNGIDSM